MIGTFKDKQLKRFFEKGTAKGVPADDAERISDILDALDAATQPEDLNLPGFGFHPLKGDRKGQYAVTIRANWRIVFEWDDGQAIRVRRGLPWAMRRKSLDVSLGVRCGSRCTRECSFVAN